MNIIGSFLPLWFQVIPQSICSRYGLAVGSNFVWLVRILMIICYPVAYPIGKVINHILDKLAYFLVYEQLMQLITHQPVEVIFLCILLYAI